MELKDLRLICEKCLPKVVSMLGGEELVGKVVDKLFECDRCGRDGSDRGIICLDRESRRRIQAHVNRHNLDELNAMGREDEQT